jgi:hypothetical protein
LGGEVTTPLEYDFPPSNAMKQLGEITDNSHFVVDGELILGDQSKFSCHFEIGYTKTCLVVGIIYVQLPDTLNIIERHTIREAIFVNQNLKLYGHDRYWNLEIEVTGLHPNSLTGDAFADQLRISFTAAQYVAWADPAPEPPEISFLLVNFPLPYWYSFQATWDAKEDTRRYYEITVSEKLVAKVYHLSDLDKREYTLQPLSSLRVQLTQIPSGWTAENVADVICALLVLSVGHDIQWTMEQTPLPETWLVPPKRKWVTRKIREGRFYAYIVGEYPPHIPDHLLPVGSFMSSTLEKLFSRAFTKVAEYLRLLVLYIDFANADSSSYTMQGRLLTTLAEELHHYWEETEGIHENKARLVWKNERRRLIEIIETAVDESATQILDRRTNEDDKEYARRITILKARIEPMIRDNINDQKFESDLLHLFDYYDYIVDSTNPHSMYKNIKAFVDSRNSLVHAGSLAHDNPEYRIERLVTFCAIEEHRQRHEYENIVLMLPIMFAAIFGYKGKYRKAISIPGDDWCDPPIKNHD